MRERGDEWNEYHKGIAGFSKRSSVCRKWLKKAYASDCQSLSTCHMVYMPKNNQIWKKLKQSTTTKKTD